jgi:hypothetical protein
MAQLVMEQINVTRGKDSFSKIALDRDHWNVTPLCISFMNQTEAQGLHVNIWMVVSNWQ